MEAAIREQFPDDLRSRIRVVPRYDNACLPELLRGQEVLLFPSRFEGFSLALLEGMAQGLAPVATLVGGAGSVVETGVNGVLVRLDDSEGLTDALAWLAADRSRLLEMRRRAQETARTYRWSKTAQRTRDLYCRLLARPGGAA
jgi:glycosyltransferase involved in cell wall biosynthesis